MWTSSAALAVTPEDRQVLERLVGSGKTEQRIVLRARIILGAADGHSNNALAKALGTSRPTVLDWRQRFAAGGGTAGKKSLAETSRRWRMLPPLAQVPAKIFFPALTGSDN